MTKFELVKVPEDDGCNFCENSPEYAVSLDIDNLYYNPFICRNCINRLWDLIRTVDF